MLTSWKEHIKKVQKEGSFTYKEAMVAASKSWKPKPKRGKPRSQKPKTENVEKAAVETPIEPEPPTV
tara:strand:- start:636 stop:836 length:201 start_codon:yes stop_codon:yes gene_type:complete